MTDLVTLIGGGGFIGRYATQMLLKHGARVRICARDPRHGFFLKTQGGLGQSQFLAADVTRPDSIARAVDGSDAVVNLVGVMGGRFQAVHVDGARMVAERARAAGARALVHLSAIGADPASPSAYARTKGEGEAAVRDAFPGATILRPSVVFGAEDQFTNRFARMAMWRVTPVIAPQTRFQPVYVGDVARAIDAAVHAPATFGGRTFELGGPEVLTMLEINRLVARLTGRDPLFVPLPDPIAAAIARVPGGPVTRDQLLLLGRDNLVSPGADDLATLGVRPTPIETVAEGWLTLYQRLGRFAAQRRAF